MKKNYSNPFVLIHGYDNMSATMAFAADILKKEGYEAFAPHVGPYISTWDRACEIWAMLVGGTVDYGKVHSKKCGHERYGKTYPGLFPEWGELGPDGITRKVNFIGHSYGGVTVRTLVYLLAEGNQDEIDETDPEELSPLFAGGKRGWVNSVTTLASPHNGVSIMGALDPIVRASLFQEFYKENRISGTEESNADAYLMDQWRFMSQDKKMTPRPDRVMKFLYSDDTAFTELNPEGVKKLTADYQPYDNIYYFSYYGRITQDALGENVELPAEDILPRYRLKSLVAANATSRFYGQDWKANDGLVDTVSARAPFNEPSTDYPEDGKVEPGIWNIMPEEHKYHTWYLGEDVPEEEEEKFYTDLADMIAGLKVLEPHGAIKKLVKAVEETPAEPEDETEYRIEHDALGEVKVPKDVYWMAQTERSRNNFRIGAGIETMPAEIIHAFGILKKAAARVNSILQPEKMTDQKLKAISAACDDVLSGKLNDQFPLVVWQTGSGTQSNMNANEVIASRANEIAGEKICHPNDDINMSQSSNDTFPTAMHIAAICALQDNLIPAIEELVATFKDLEAQNEGIIKCGRTHLQDAVPIAFSQEISGWRSSLERDIDMLNAAVEPLRSLALGGTAVGTGLNAPKDFDTSVAKNITALTGHQFVTAENKFHALTSKDEMVFAHGAIKALAADMMKIANDVRWLASGPRLGLGEITIPANEPGSSIMPGKVNPTQCEQVTMVAVQVMGNDAAIGMAASQGNFELNVFMPVIAYNFLQSARLMADSIRSFNKNCAVGIQANKDKMDENLHRSLMLVTALNPVIGYEHSAKTAQLAFKENISLKEACVKLGYLTEEEFDDAFHPENMV